MFYFDFACWYRMLRYAIDVDRDPRRRRKLLLLLLVRVPLVAGVNAICFALDPLLFPGLRRTRIREPVFVIGHARSGTKLFWPALIPKKLIRSAARIDARHLGGRIGRWLEKRSDARYSKTRDAHHQVATYPEEDDGILTYSRRSRAC